MSSRTPLLAFLLTVLTAADTRADGGLLRCHEHVGPYRIAVFTAPTPLRAGAADISVLVQDDQTGRHVPEASVTLRLTDRTSGQVLDLGATSAAATNKLFHAALLDLPSSGWWDVEVTVVANERRGSTPPAADGGDEPRRSLVRFALHVDEPLPPWQELLPWFTWPALAVALFLVHHSGILRHRARPARKSSVG